MCSLIGPAANLGRSDYNAGAARMRLLRDAGAILGVPLVND
jgi:hypothetical protein